MAEAALAGDGDTVRAIAEVINQVEGKPVEFKQQGGSQSRTLVIHGERPNVPPPELPV